MEAKGNSLTQGRRDAEVAEKVRLGDVCSIVYGERIRKKDSVGGAYPVYGGGGETFRWPTFNRENKCVVSRFAMSRECVRFVTGKFFLNDSGLTVEAKDERSLSQYYLDWFLFGSQEKIYSLGQGAAQKNLEISRFINLKIPLPPLPAQRRIAAELDKICELKKNAETRLEKLDLLVKSRFVEMFGDGIAEKSLPDICEIIDGDRGKNYPTQGDFSSDGYCLFLNAKNVTKNGFAFEETSFITKTKDESLRKGKLTRGDVVLTTRGTIGNIAYFDETVPYSNIRINSGMVILRMDNERLNQIYFTFAFKKKMQVLMRKLVSGSAQPQLPISVMRKIMLPVPPLSLQREFAAFVEKVDKLRVNIRATVAKMDMLYRSKLQEHFG